MTEPHLKRSLSLFDVIVYGLLYFVPIAPVAVFGAVYNLSNGMAASTYLLGGIAMAFSALSYSEMARRIPLSGSVYSYVSGGAGPVFGFLAGWMLLLDYMLSPALLAVLGAAALAPLFPGVPGALWLVLFVALPFAVNLLGISVNVQVGKVMLVIQLAVLALFVWFALGRIGTLPAANLIAPLYNPGFRLAMLFGAVPVAAFSYLGFDAVSTLNEEAKGGGATVSRATLLLLFIVTLLFMAQVYLAAVFVTPGTHFAPGAAEDTAFYTISARVAGAWFLPVITLTNAGIAIFANALIAQAATARVMFVMARDGRLPRMLDQVNGRGAPARALAVVAGVSLAIALAGQHQIEAVVTMVTFGAMSAYVMLHMGVVWFFRRRADRSIFAHVISPVLGSAVLVYALINANIRAQTLGLSWAAVGVIVVLVLWRRGALKQKVAGL